MMAGAGLSAAAWLVVMTLALGQLRRGDAEAAQPFLLTACLCAVVLAAFSSAAGLVPVTWVERP